MGDTLVWKITIENKGGSKISNFTIEDIVINQNINDFYDLNGKITKDRFNKRIFNWDLLAGEKYTFYIYLKIPIDEISQIVSKILTNNNLITDHIELYTGINKATSTIFRSNTVTGKLLYNTYSLNKKVASWCFNGFQARWWTEWLFTSWEIITYQFTIKAIGGTLTGATIIDVFSGTTPPHLPFFSYKSHR